MCFVEHTITYIVVFLRKSCNIFFLIKYSSKILCQLSWWNWDMQQGCMGSNFIIHSTPFPILLLSPSSWGFPWGLPQQWVLPLTKKNLLMMFLQFTGKPWCDIRLLPCDLELIGSNPRVYIYRPQNPVGESPCGLGHPIMLLQFIFEITAMHLRNAFQFCFSVSC